MRAQVPRKSMASLTSFARCGRSAVGAGGCAETRPASPSVKIQARAGATLRKLATIAWLPANTTMRRDLDAILPQRPPEKQSVLLSLIDRPVLVLAPLCLAIGINVAISVDHDSFNTGDCHK